MRIRRLGLMPYDEAWRLQQQLHAQVVDGAEDVALLLEHLPVYTAGRRTEPWELPADGTPVLDVDRGGKITWHGPGQVTGYPIVRLADPVDVVAYVRRLERLLIDVCAELGLPTGRVEGRSGVWTTDGARKVAAIGIRVARGVTMHGFALNCDPDLAAYDRIVPHQRRDGDVAEPRARPGGAYGRGAAAARTPPAVAHGGARRRLTV